MQPENPQTNQPSDSLESGVENKYNDNDTRETTTNVTFSVGGIETSQQDDEQDTVRDEASQPVMWQAKEYISPDKNAMWYLGLGVVVVAVILLDVFIIKAYTVSLLILAIAAVLVVMSIRPPRVIDYTLSDEGLKVGEQQFNLNEYKSFGVVHDGKENSVLLIPIKRFKPGLSVYFPVESGEAIVDLLGSRLPMQEIHLDFVDRIVRMLRL
jgi:hypothetical protein